MENHVEILALGQAGYLITGYSMRVAIDPYLSDSAAASDRRFTRLFPPPIAPEALCVDVYIVTHAHLDHLDPDTIRPYAHKSSTRFIAPRLCGKELEALGIPRNQITVVDHAGHYSEGALAIDGVFALGTTPDTVDTCGYKLTFGGKKSVYHCADTSHCSLLLRCAPNADVLLVCINGKFGNLNIPEAVELTRAVAPRYVIPNHYDVMALNSENPESFRYQLESEGLNVPCVILEHGESFVL